MAGDTQPCSSCLKKQVSCERYSSGKWLCYVCAGSHITATATPSNLERALGACTNMILDAVVSGQDPREGPAGPSGAPRKALELVLSSEMSLILEAASGQTEALDDAVGEVHDLISQFRDTVKTCD